LDVINPTLNFQVGDLSELPVPPGGGEALMPLVNEAIELQRRIDAFDETSSDFVQPAITVDLIRSDLRRLCQIEQEIDSIVAELYGIDANSQVQQPAGPEFADVARRCVSYAIGRMVGRWSGHAPNDPIVQLAPPSRGLVDRVKAELASIGDAKLADEVERELRGLRRFIERDFYNWHVGLYARRPIYWAFGDADRIVMLAHDRADASDVTFALRDRGATPPQGWSRHIDDGIAVNLSPLADHVADRALRKSLQSVASDLDKGKLNWSETARALSPGWTGGSGRARSRKPPRRRSSTACSAESRT
jgi:hypothetical protein